jgi:hypothetical protein
MALSKLREAVAPGASGYVKMSCAIIRLTQRTKPNIIKQKNHKCIRTLHFWMSEQWPPFPLLPVHATKMTSNVLTGEALQSASLPSVNNMICIEQTNLANSDTHLYSHHFPLNQLVFLDYWRNNINSWSLGEPALLPSVFKWMLHAKNLTRHLLCEWRFLSMIYVPSN